MYESVKQIYSLFVQAVPELIYLRRRYHAPSGVSTWKSEAVIEAFRQGLVCKCNKEHKDRLSSTESSRFRYLRFERRICSRHHRAYVRQSEQISPYRYAPGPYSRNCVHALGLFKRQPKIVTGFAIEDRQAARADFLCALTASHIRQHNNCA